jgi:DNA-binding NarL/FixJ family response regulator
MTKALAVAVLCGERVFQDALAAVLSEAGFDVVLLASPRETARLAGCAADVVVLQAESEQEPPQSAVARILEAAPEARIIVVGLADSDPAIVACIEAGAHGHTVSDTSLADLIAGISAVARGESLCSPRTTFALFGRLTELARTHGAGANDALSARELRIVALIAGGMSNREIASTLNLSRHTVKNHIHHILEKLRVSTRADAVRFAVNHGLIR